MVVSRAKEMLSWTPRSTTCTRSNCKPATTRTTSPRSGAPVAATTACWRAFSRRSPISVSIQPIL